MVLADGGAVVHGVEGGDLVDAGGGHLEQAGDLVHDANGGEAVLALAEVEQGHDGGLLVLRRVPLQDLRDHRLVRRAELERDLRVVVARVPVLLSSSGDFTNGSAWKKLGEKKNAQTSLKLRSPAFFFRFILFQRDVPRQERRSPSDRRP